MDNNVIETLKNAIRDTYNETIDYFYPTKGRERSMVFRIAHHLASKIEKNEIFVDIEATRCNGLTKRTYRSKMNYNETIIVPDLIVHERQGKGYLVVEFKCNKCADSTKHDYDKLKLFTKLNKDENLSKCCPTYEIGAFVYLGNHIDDIRITLFKNGEVIKDKENVSLHKI